MRLYASLLLLLICSACGRGQDSSQASGDAAQGSARINLGANPETLDPRKARDLSSSTVCTLIFEGLTRLGPDGKVVPGVAEEIVPNKDFTRYLFRLRRTLWSDGTPVTARDFEETWKQIVSPQFPAPQAALLYCIKNARAIRAGSLPVEALGVRAVDDYTLAVDLEYPVPYLAELTAMRTFLPVNQQVEGRNPNWALKASSQFISNGPFELAEWKQGDHISLRPNPRYWDATAVHLKSLELVMVDEKTELLMFERGELDWAGSPLSRLPLDSISSLREQGRLISAPAAATGWVRCNVLSAPLDQPKIRRALAYAIDRKALAEHVLQGGQTPALGIVPPTLAVSDVPYFKDNQPEAARRLFDQALEETGLTRKKLPTLTLSYAADELNKKVAETLQEQWRKTLDIKVELKGVEKAVFWSSLGQHDYQLAVGAWFADFRDATNFLDVFSEPGGSNNTQWEDPVYGQLLTMARAAEDTAKRQRLLQIAERRLIQAMPALPLFYYSLCYARSPRLTGVVVSELGILDFKYAQIKG